MTIDELRAVEQTERRRIEVAAEHAVRDRGIFDPTLNRWIEWNHDGPTTPKTSTGNSR